MVGRMPLSVSDSFPLILIISWFGQGAHSHLCHDFLLVINGMMTGNIYAACSEVLNMPNCKRRLGRGLKEKLRLPIIRDRDVDLPC